jgi:hypothetical protein
MPMPPSTHKDQAATASDAKPPPTRADGRVRMSLTVAMDLVVCGVLLAGLSTVARYLDPDLARLTFFTGVVGGALCVLWAILGRRGTRCGWGAMGTLVAVDKPMTVQSLHGPEVTMIQGCQVPGTTNGDGAIRCVYLTNGAVLIGFTLTNGATRDAQAGYRQEEGGGLCCESPRALVTNCALTGNSAYYGGGAYSGTLDHCLLMGNSAPVGGGACSSTLNRCTLAGNSASRSDRVLARALHQRAFTAEQDER